ncbi:MAG: HlyD family efflux transporter periplasmic adaptor subunit [Burkholderiales bacterium]|nr:HlyD family efflux transporter periplasmic adaptor subunit [Burkholderiales bacterium]
MTDEKKTEAVRRRRTWIPVAVGATVMAAGGGWLLMRSHERPAREAFTGYVVSDDVTMSSPVGGTVTRVAVRRGERVTPGQALFDVDPTIRAAQADQAGAQIAASQAAVAQQEAALLRARSELGAAQADADRAGAELRRLLAAQREKAGAVAALQIEQAQAAASAALDKRAGAQAAVQTAAAAVLVAKAQLAQAQAGLRSARRELADLAPVAPSAGRVEDVMFQAGESVSANAPVVTLVPDGEVKVRFYVPEALVHGYGPGRQVAIACDGCPAGMSATVDFVATRPEYTPPIIYSLDARQKLVWLVEARPSDPAALVPGQPMDVAATSAGLKRR